MLQRDGEYNYFDVNYVNEVDGIRLYENPYALSLGYMVNNDLLDYDGDIGNMFETLNQFVKLSTVLPGYSLNYIRRYPHTVITVR